jgi:glycosyltransferase involved in cell wall biosynthesis
MKHILIIASYGPSLVNFRLNLIKTLLSKGYKVSVATTSNNFKKILQKKLKIFGVKINFFSLSRTGFNIFEDFKFILEIFGIIKYSRPNVIISYTAKPVIYTGFVLKFFPKIIYYPLITGLGFAFTNNNSFNRNLLRNIMIFLYRIGLKQSKKIFFQNKDDKKLFLQLRIVKDKKKTFIVNGSGVDLNAYHFSSLPSKHIFLMIARLLIDKGIREYFQAAIIVKKLFPNTKFRLIGDFDQNPSSIDIKELRLWIKKAKIDYLGKKNSVKSALKACRYFVLPSYREGTPRSILEALSTGRPIITTDVPGCRETVIHKKNGLLVPPKNALALAKAMIKLIKKNDKALCSMGKASYLLAKKKYEISKVNKFMLNTMKL